MATKTRRRPRRAGRPTAAQAKKLRARDDEILSLHEQGVEIPELAERFDLDRKTIRDAIGRAKGRREEKNAAGVILTSEEKAHISKSYRNGKFADNPEVRAWTDRLCKLGHLDPAGRPNPSGEPLSDDEPVHVKQMPHDWKGWRFVIKDEEDEDSGVARLPRRRRKLIPRRD